METPEHIEAYQPLFKHMKSEHGLILVQSEMDEIIGLSKDMEDKVERSNFIEETKKVYYCNSCCALNEFDCCCDDGDEERQEMALINIMKSDQKDGMYD